jgi:hypothetical protein
MTATVSDTFDRILRLIHAGALRISEHGYDELAADDILARITRSRQS